MTQAAKQTVEQTTEFREVLFFELEYLAVEGRKALFDIVKDLFKGEGDDISPAVFARCATASRPAEVVAALLTQRGGKTTGNEKLMAQAEERMLAFFNESAVLNPQVPPLIEAARKRDIRIVAISAWPSETARALLNRLGLEDVDLEAFDTHDPFFPRADHWLRMIKNCKQTGIPAIGVVASHPACKGALTSGVACIAVPDAHSGFADFSGARVLLDSLGDLAPDEILDRVSRR